MNELVENILEYPGTWFLRTWLLLNTSVNFSNRILILHEVKQQVKF